MPYHLAILHTPAQRGKEKQGEVANSRPPGEGSKNERIGELLDRTGRGCWGIIWPLSRLQLRYIVTEFCLLTCDSEGYPLILIPLKAWAELTQDQDLPWA